MMTDDRISEIASPFLEWTEQGYAIIDKVGFANALLAAGASEGKAEPVAYLVTIGGHPSLQFSWIDPANLAKCNTCEPLYLSPSAEIAALRERIAGMEKDAGMTYERIAEKLSNDGYSKQADVIRQIVAKEQQQ